MRISRSALILLLPLLLSLLLSACGDGGAASTVVPSSPKAEVLMHVDEVDSSGRVEMRHNFSTGDSANEEIITTTQDPGIDGVWGTADDWRTLETRCVFQPGGENIPVDEIMPFESTFYFWLTPQACTWRRPLTGSVDIEMTGMLLPQYFVEFLRDSLKSESDPWPQDGSRELLRAGDVLGVFALWEGEPMKKKSSLRAEEGGTVSCLDDCQPTETATPELADCYRACSLFGETLPPSGVGSEAMEACGNEVQRYNGTRYMTFYANG